MNILNAVLALATGWSLCSGHQQDICEVCDCLPHGLSPVQAFCIHNRNSDKVFSPTTTATSLSLELVYISGMKAVSLQQNSLVTGHPVTLLIHNCSSVHISDHSVPQLQTLVVRGASSVRIGVLTPVHLWTTLLEDIEQLTLNSSSLKANYSVTVGQIGSLTLWPSNGEDFFENSELQFFLFNAVMEPIPEGGLIVCGGHVTIDSCLFKSVAEGAIQVVADISMAIVNNKFQHLEKRAFNLSSPVIHISSNYFEKLPASALSDISTIQDTFFINNTIEDIDLGGVLLDMGWDMIMEQNTIYCDCAFKRTSILNPKQDMLYLTNSSYEKLHNIFLNNFCNLNCTVTLSEFSYALKHSDICATNDTQLEQDKLCPFSVITEFPINEDGYPLVSVTESSTYNDGNLLLSTTQSSTNEDGNLLLSTTQSSTKEDGNPLVSAASRVEFLVPLSIILVTVLLTSSVCYGCKEMKAFKYTFDPNTNSAPNIPLQ